MQEHDYSYPEICQALKALDLSQGDSIFVHSNIGFFGRLEGAKFKEDYYQAFKSAIFETIGHSGTLIVPTFSYSFCNGQVFEQEKTPSVCGFFSEMLRLDPASCRSADANFSVAAIGKNAALFCNEADELSFGPKSFWAKFLEQNGKLCNFNFDSGSTFIHYVERCLKVPYRYDKPFPGVCISNGKTFPKTFYHFVYDLKKPKTGPEFTKFDQKAKQAGLAKTVNLGRGQIVVISARDSYDLIKNELRHNPSFLTKGEI